MNRGHDEESNPNIGKSEDTGIVNVYSEDEDENDDLYIDAATR